MQLLHLHRAEFADLAQVVSAQIHQHIVLRQLLFVGQQLRLQRGVLFVGRAPGPRARQREGVQHAVFQLHQCLRGSARHLHVRARKVEHIGRGVQGAQDAVGVQEAPLKGGAQPVGEHDLKDVALPYVALRPLHHVAELIPVKQRLHRPRHAPAGLHLLLALRQQLSELPELQHRAAVASVGVVQRHVHDQHDLLPEVVKGDHLVKQHQVHIPEGLGVLHLPAHAGLAVAQVVVGEIAHQPAGEGGQLFKARALVLGQDLPQHRGRVVGLYLDAARLQLAVQAGDLQLRVVAQEGIAAPLLLLRHRFQHIAVGGHLFQDPHALDRRQDIRQDFAVDRSHPVFAGRGDALDLVQAGFDVHALRLLALRCHDFRRSPAASGAVAR